MTGALLHDSVAESVKRYPDATAVVMGPQRLSYIELDRLADGLAAALKDHGCEPGDRICLFASKSPGTIAAMIACLRVGCIYVPIDVTGPAHRTARIVNSVRPAAAFVLGAGATFLETLISAGEIDGPVPAIDIDEGDPKAGAAGSVPPSPTITPEHPAHILFTSGSTGHPKGVVVTHRSVRAYIDWAIEHFGIQHGDRCSGHSPLHFDLSTFDVYATLAAGGELHLLPPQILLPRQLTEYILDSALDQLFCVPSAMTYLSSSAAIPADGFSRLRRILWCGEVLPTPVLIDWMSRHPNASFTNLYGPTEATIASSYQVIDAAPLDPSQPIPIGTACAGEELLILDDDGAPADDGVIGELCIGGVGLSPGYWEAPDLTATVFVDDPRPGRSGNRIYRTGDLARRNPQGVFEFVGRRDSQIKHRGYRIELGEIEAAVGALSAVAECAVVAVETKGFEGTTICCAVVTRAEHGDVTPGSLRAELIKQLPSYMLPARWWQLDVLPKNVNGKIDRRAIREHFDQKRATP